VTLFLCFKVIKQLPGFRGGLRLLRLSRSKIETGKAPEKPYEHETADSFGEACESSDELKSIY
jgi:hypothetical protein